MTEKEYNAACDKIVRQYYQQEERIISEKKRTGSFGQNPEKDYDLFLRLNQKMRRQLQYLEKQYLSQSFHSVTYHRRTAV